MSKNGGPPTVLMYVDQSLTLWAFLDVYGSTQKIRILGSSIIETPRPSMISKFTLKLFILLTLTILNLRLELTTCES